MNEDEYIEMRKKEMHLIKIKVDKKDKDKAFEVLIESPFAMIGYPDEEYTISELALRILDKEKIKYEVME